MPKSYGWDDLSFGKGEKMEVLKEFELFLREQDHLKLKIPISLLFLSEE
jgi:hypothetical protein